MAKMNLNPTKCQCKPECTAMVMTSGRLYARGHNPICHQDYAKKGAGISAAINRKIANGTFVNHFKGKTHTPAARQKIQTARVNRTPEQQARLTAAVRKATHDRPEWSEANKAHMRELAQANVGKHHSEETKLKMSASARAVRLTRTWLSWNKGQTGLQLAWNKGLNKNTDERVAKISAALVGHTMSAVGRRKMSKAAKRRGVEFYRNLAQKRQAKYAVTGNPRIGKSSYWSIGVMTKSNRRFKHLQHGPYWFRSTWELAYAKWCEAQNLDYTYEPKTFRLSPGVGKSNTYTPDFYHPKSNLYVEIKGYMSEHKAQQLHEFKQMYPDVILALLMKDELKALGVL